MSTCPSCGGWIGRDCFNPAECATITAQMHAGNNCQWCDELARSHAALEAEIQHAIREAKSYEPDYPWTQNTITEAVRALGSSLQGTSQANADLHAENKRLREALEKIARYDSGNGCCTYGCDTPTIAKITLGEQA